VFRFARGKSLNHRRIINKLFINVKWLCLGREDSEKRRKGFWEAVVS